MVSVNTSSNMSSSSSSAAFTTELDARFAFVMNPVEFLENVTAAIRNESDAANAAMLNMLIKHGYHRMIAKSVSHDNAPVRDHAMWCLANLLGSENNQVRDAAIKAVTGTLNLDAVFREVQTPTGRSAERGAFFLLENICRFALNELSKAQVATIVNTLTTSASTDKECLNSAHFALTTVADKYVDLLPVAYLLIAFNLNCDTGPLVRCLGNLAQVTGALESYVPDVLNVLETQIVYGGYRGKALGELLWTLSNVVTEKGAADTFVEAFGSLYDTVLHYASSDVEREAVWVLANTVAKARSESVKRVLLEDKELDSVFWTLLTHESAKMRQLASEALCTLNQFRDELPPSSPEALLLRLEVRGYDDVLIRRVGEMAEDTGALTAHLPQAFATLRTLLCAVSESKKVKELLWILSNLLVEAGAASAFLNAGLLSIVLETAEAGTRGVFGEAIHVLANIVHAVAHGSDVEQKRWLTEESRLYELLSEAANSSVRAVREVATEALSFVELMYDDVLDADIEETFNDLPPAENADDDMEIDDGDVGGETILEAVPAPSLKTEDNFPPVPNVSRTLLPVPSSLELMYGGLYGHSSAVLRRLVGLLLESGNIYGTVVVPEDAVFTAADFTAIHAMGYYIWNGRFGIMPHLMPVQA